MYLLRKMLMQALSFCPLLMLIAIAWVILWMYLARRIKVSVFTTHYLSLSLTLYNRIALDKNSSLHRFLRIYTLVQTNPYKQRNTSKVKHQSELYFQTLKCLNYTIWRESDKHYWKRLFNGSKKGFCTHFLWFGKKQFNLVVTGRVEEISERPFDHEKSKI